MNKKPVSGNSRKASAQPRLHQSARELQAFGTVTSMQPLQLEEPVRLEMTEQLNQLLADTMTLRDLYKKSHWQVSGATFYQLHLLFDKHYEEQSELVDTIAERIQLLGGISIAMAPDVAETTKIPRPPKGREEVPVQLSRLLEAETARAALRKEYRESEDPGDQRRILVELSGHIENQLELVRSRRQELEKLEQELTEKRRTVRARLAELEPEN